MGTRDQPGLELDSAVRSLHELGATLAESYALLERRAQRVEAELERKLADLDELSRHLESILEALPTGVVVRDGAGAIRRANRAALAILGLAEAEIVGRASHPLLQRVGGASPGTELVCGDGRTRTVAARTSPIAAPIASPIASIGTQRTAGSVQILDDRTELTALQERLHAQEKLAALGNMAGGIAHELRNPMNAIKGFASLLAARTAGGTKERRWAELIVRGVGEADAILTSMLTLARAEPLVRETIDARALVAAAVEAACEGREPSELDAWRVDVRLEPDPLPPFVADALKLRQALRNLIANAFDAQPAGGTVAIAVEHRGHEIFFGIADAGPGVPDELRRRVLEPFFTTRAEGTGLGLALVDTIARLHGGRVSLTTAPSALGGAEFQIHIPHVPDSH